MPDDDRIPRALTGAWRRVLRSLQGQQPAERTASMVVSALAATLRSVQGVPGLHGIAAQMHHAARAGLVTGSWMPASDAARRHVPTRVAERAAAALVATMREKLALVSPDQAAMMLAERVVHDLAYAYGLDRIAPVLLAEGRYDTAELQRLLAEAQKARSPASAPAACSSWRPALRPRGASDSIGCGYLRTSPRGADRALALTVSCDAGFAARILNRAPCGACTSCLLRRQALHAAGRARHDPDGAYHYRKGSSPAKLLQVMLWQVGRLRTCLAQPDPWLALVSEFPEVLDTAPLTAAEVIDVYRNYVREWEGLERGFPTGSQVSLRAGTLT